MSRSLLIVESPTKAQTIRRLLGENYEVVASQGHVRDLPERGLGVRIEKSGEIYKFIPLYQPLPKKLEAIQKIREALYQASNVYVATDEDREGEAIAWHLCELLGIDGTKPVRIAFHEITKRALEEALKVPRSLNFHLVEAQQARRILDRLVGYQISPLLWRTFARASKRKSALSAGRVQSVALRLVVEREREIAAFQASPSIVAEITIQSSPVFKALLITPTFHSTEEGEHLLKQLVGRQLRVHNLTKKRRRRSPSPPFTTSTLQQEAQRRLGFSIRRTMQTAQNLYEKGLITYMRTDSVHIAPEALEAIHSVLGARFSPEVVVTRTWEEKRSLHAQEAHEAIRPTDPFVEEAGDTPDEKKIYALIWRRTLASQMADAVYEETIAHLIPDPPSITPLPEFQAKGRILVEPGFLSMYGYTTDEEEAAPLPPLERGDLFSWKELRIWEKYPSPPSRYTEGTLVRELEERGIGRPSTYVPTLENLFKRQYVERATVRVARQPYEEILITPTGEVNRQRLFPSPEVQKNKLVPTSLGTQVMDFLMERFPDIMDYDFTARVEEELDQIAAEKLDWQVMLSAFYTHFTAELRQAASSQKRSHLLGVDPLSQKPIYLHVGSRGAYVARGEKGDPDYHTASVPTTLSPNKVCLEKALQLLSFPRVIGNYEGQLLTVRSGPYGYYLHHGGKNYPLPPHSDPLLLTEAEAIAIIQAHRQKAPSVLRSFPEAGIQILNGRYGPYIRYQGGTCALPKGIPLENITLEVCQALLQAKVQGRARRRSKQSKRQ
ncbi:MAG: type I DNA topoisomerase [Bacteroidia bacterium]|nr:type I DNA topoisomerase [Bacteroidia bacterium]MDW8014549.1 type I DNA topoisomerase [Bacteroidia bacterium]